MTSQHLYFLAFTWLASFYASGNTVWFALQTDDQQRTLHESLNRIEKAIRITSWITVNYIIITVLLQYLVHKEIQKAVSFKLHQSMSYDIMMSKVPTLNICFSRRNPRVDFQNLWSCRFMNVVIIPAFVWLQVVIIIWFTGMCRRGGHVQHTQGNRKRLLGRSYLGHLDFLQNNNSSVSYKYLPTYFRPWFNSCMINISAFKHPRRIHSKQCHFVEVSLLTNREAQRFYILRDACHSKYVPSYWACQVGLCSSSIVPMLSLFWLNADNIPL